MPRDQRDPQLLGEAYLKFRKAGIDLETAVLLPVQEFDATHQGPLEKYGDPRAS